MTDSLQKFARLLAQSLQPLTGALSGSDAGLIAFVEKLGWTLPAVPPSLKALGTSAGQILTASQNLDVSLTLERNGGTVSADTAAQYLALATGVNDFLSALRSLPSGLQAELPPAFVAATDFPNQFPRRLLDYCLCRLMLRATKRLEPILQLAGIVEMVEEPADLAKFQPAYTRSTIHWDRLSRLLSDPSGLMQDIYGWGTAAINAEALMDNLMDLSFDLAGPAEIDWPTPARIQALTGTLPSYDKVGLPQITIPLLEQGTFRVEVSVLPLAAGPGLPVGIALGIFASAGLPPEANLTDLIHLTFDGPDALALGISVALRAGQPPQVRIGLEGPTGAALNTAKAGATLRMERRDPLELLSLPGGSGLTVQAVTLSSGVALRSKGAEPFFEVGLEGGKLTLALGGGDSFLQQIMPGGPLALSFETGLGWTPSGVALRGSAALSVSVPTHTQIGPVQLDYLYLASKLSANAIQLETSLSAKTQLGPLGLDIERIGLNSTLLLSQGNLGPLDFQLAFKPPNGVGLSLDAGGFTGGGFLYFDEDKGEYAGALELDFKGIVTVKAVGIVNTRMPDGQPGYSLLILISAEFTPIQLSFGFTLNGVGGLIGLNRGMSVSALADGIRTNAIQSVLFPQDVIANITRIISDLKLFFPPQADRFLVGPMAKLGWGTPSIVTLELGLLLNLPDPMFAIVGVLKAILPDEDAPILRLQVNFIGVVDFEHGYVFFRADLYDSRLLVYTITGSLAFLVSWGEQQTFAVSVGGFHPDFHDYPAIPALPDGFRNMARIGLSLLSDDNPRLKVESYFAVTANTVQFGARVELYAEAAGFNVYGFLGYDVLFQFEPFHFLASLAGGIALREGTDVIAGISISARLSGPTPWDARGDATLSILFFDITVSFHVTWGDPPPAISSETADLLQMLKDTLADSRNWRAELPPDNHLGVTIKKIEPPAGQSDLLVINPAGVVTFSQRTLPLENYEIQKFGTKKPLKENRFQLSNVDSGGTAISADFQSVRESFAPANFSELSDSDKLSRASFAHLPSGFKLTATMDLLVAGLPVVRDVIYELSYLRQQKVQRKGLVKMIVQAYNRLVKGSAVRQSALARQQTRASLNAPPAVTLPQEAFIIASISDLKPHAGAAASGPAVFATQAEAYQHYQNLLRQDPALSGQIQVVSQFELNQS